MTTYPNRWTVGEWTFYEVADHGFGEAFRDRSLFTYGPAARDGEHGEMYRSLDHAMVAAVTEKHVGHNGTGGASAADWFMKMIGAGQLHDAGPAGGRALTAAVHDNQEGPLAAYRIERTLADQGYIIARQAV